MSHSPVFLYVRPGYILKCCKLLVRKRMHASRHECVQIQRERERKREKKRLKSLSFLNDAHTETMGRRSD